MRCKMEVLGTVTYLHLNNAANSMPANLFFRRGLDPSKLINKLLIFKRSLWKADLIKMGNNFHKSPKLLP